MTPGELSYHIKKCEKKKSKPPHTTNFMSWAHDLGTGNWKDRIQRVALLGHGALVGKRASGFALEVHGINILADLANARVLVFVVTALETTLDVLTKGLNHPHVIYPSLVLLLFFAGAVTNV